MKKIVRKTLLLILVIIASLLLPKQVEAANKVIDVNNTGNFNKTKVEIQNKWKSSNLDIPANYSIYSVEPIYEGPNYRAGVVKQEYLDKVLANLNYYRYLIGSPIITTQMKNRPDLQTAEVCQYISMTKQKNGLTHNLRECFKKPSDMSQAFYDLGVDAEHGIISTYDYHNPIFPFFDETVFMPGGTAIHRLSLLLPNVTKVEFGLGKRVYGDTHSLGFDYNSMQGVIAAYPSPGYFPKQDFAYASNWDIYLNLNYFSKISFKEIENIVVTIKDVQKNITYTYRVSDGNLDVGEREILIKRPDRGNKSYYDGDYEVCVKNLKDKSGNLVDLKYTVKFFDKFEHIEPEKNEIVYRTHVQEEGWQDWKKNGQMSGTSGKSHRLEGIEIKLQNAEYKGGITYSTHVQNIGWQDWKTNGEMSGTSGKSLRLEAIKIKLTGEMANKYDIYYRVHAQEFGWLDWAKNGEQAGTSGYGYRLEGIEIKLVEKGKPAPGTTANAFRKAPPTIKYTTQVQNVGWQKEVKDGAISGTVGKGLRLEGIRISLNNSIGGGIEYRTHVQNLGWEKDWKTNGETSGTVGKSLRLEAIQIRLTGEMAKKYDIYYRVHSQEFGWLGWAKNGEQAGTSGYSYRLEGIEIKLIEKGKSAPGNTANHYKTK